MEPAINFNPGIPGFIKAHRHPEGPSIVMTHDEEAGSDWISVFWVGRLRYNAMACNSTSLLGKDGETRKIAEKLYMALFEMGPPPDAFPDFQRERVYDWEQDIIFPRYQRLSWIGCKRFLNRVWREVGEGDPPKLVDDQRYLDPVSLGGVIHLPPQYPSCWIKPVLLHEITHEIASGWHGPQFVSAYMGLCVEFLGLDRRLLADTADRYGVLY